MAYDWEGHESDCVGYIVFPSFPKIGLRFLSSFSFDETL